MVTTIYCLGAMIGALSGGAFFKYGKWNMIMFYNFNCLIGYGFCL